MPFRAGQVELFRPEAKHRSLPVALTHQYVFGLKLSDLVQACSKPVVLHNVALNNSCF